MKKQLARIGPVVVLVVGQMFTSPAPAWAHGCAGTAPAQTTCTRSHGAWTFAEPEPEVDWGVGFTGVIEAKVVGRFGATSIVVCNVVAGGGTCSTPRDDHMQCCTETWQLICTANGVGTWSCDHSGG